MALNGAKVTVYHHQSKFRFMYSNSDFILDDFAVTRHNSNKFDSALV